MTALPWVFTAVSGHKLRHLPVAFPSTSHIAAPVPYLRCLGHTVDLSQGNGAPMAGQEMFELYITVNGDDPAAVESASAYLLDELRDLDFQALERVTDQSRVPGTRAADPATIGTLLAIVSSPVVLRAAVNVIQSWLTRQERGTITLSLRGDTITLSKATSKEQAALVEAYVARNNLSADD
jgi:hypothetical protein